MTPWRLEQLWEGYRVTHQELVRELETDRIRDVKRAARDASAEAIEAGREMVRQTVWTTLGARRTNGQG